MAEINLSTTWIIKDYLSKTTRPRHRYVSFNARKVPDLQHASLPGVTWELELYPGPSVGRDFCKEGYTQFYLIATLPPSGGGSLKSVWAAYDFSLLASDDKELQRLTLDLHKFGPASEKVDTQHHWGKRAAFSQDLVKQAIRSNGDLVIRVRLTISNIMEMSKCTKLLQDLYGNKSFADFNIFVGQRLFPVHKSILAERSSVFASMFENSGMQEAKLNEATLDDTTPTAFEAFLGAVYCAKLDFLKDEVLTQGVLYLAEKYNVSDIKTHCDDLLFSKVDSANALRILTESAALCDAAKTRAACIGFLARRTVFKTSQEWIAFKKSKRVLANDILESIVDKLNELLIESANRVGQAHSTSA